MLSLFLLYLLSINLCYGSAITPPRGWNSWDSYGRCINETQVLNNANAMKTHLQSFGYEYIVIDAGWESNVNNQSDVSLDEYGRLQPDPQKFPHGFKWLSDQIHSMGLKFGLHAFRGIYIAAVNANKSIYGTNNTVFTSEIIYDPPQWCAANNPSKNPFQSVNINKYGGQEYYNSMYEQYCNEWNVDFIKFDCVFGKKFVPDQIIAAQNAMIHECNQDNIVYSLSPGNYLSPQQNSNYSKTGIYNDSNMYRITGDTWDKWSEIIEHFNVTANFHSYTKHKSFNGYSWPDLDMLPLGYLTTRGSNQPANRNTNLTHSQQRVLMSLWSIARSPLIYGGDMIMLKNDSFTLNLITNKYALDVNYNSTNNSQVYVEINPSNGMPMQSIWFAIGSNMKSYYVGMFNLNDKTINMNISFAKLHLNSYKSCEYYSIWNNTAQQSGQTENQIVSAKVHANDVVFYYLDQCK